MKILSVCRGAPGLGRIVPSVGLCQTMARIHGAEVTFASYSAGYAYLAATGREVIDLGRPDGLFIDSVAPQAIRVLEAAEALQPDLILIDGEFFLTATVAHLPASVAYLANPHDLEGPANTFRRVNRLLFAHADAVIISSLSCTRPRSAELVPGTSCLMVPPIIKEFPPWCESGSRKILISLGGGSVRADPAFRLATDRALTAALDGASDLIRTGLANAVTVVLGADSTLPARQAEWLTVADRPVELTSLYGDYDMFVTRAGRNAAAEALYCGIPTVLLPVTADQHRGSEQASNAAVASAAASHIFSVPNWDNPGAMLRAFTSALATSGQTYGTGVRGNESSAQFLAAIVSGVNHPDTRFPELAERS